MHVCVKHCIFCALRFKIWSFLKILSSKNGFHSPEGPSFIKSESYSCHLCSYILDASFKIHQPNTKTRTWNPPDQWKPDAHLSHQKGNCLQEKHTLVPTVKDLNCTENSSFPYICECKDRYCKYQLTQTLFYFEKIKWRGSVNVKSYIIVKKLDPKKRFIFFTWSDWN